MMKKLREEISSLTHAVREVGELWKNELEWRKSHEKFATKQDLERMEHNIMTKIEEFAAAQNAFNDRIDTAVTGLTGDVQTLNDKITELQNSPGAITPEDQALLDAIQVRSEGIATKLEALDALTPPKPPVG